MISSSFVCAIDAQAAANPSRVAFFNSHSESITYAELRRLSDALACWISRNDSITPQVPLIVYGHKSPLMLVCFLACAKSGHAYVAVDTIYPVERITSIAGQIGKTAVLDTICDQSPLAGIELGIPYFDVSGIVSAFTEDSSAYAAQAAELAGVGQDDAFYVLFTSGSTGTPKGVVITTQCVDEFYRWTSHDFVGANDPVHIFYNRTPFSFDVSLTDMACGLTRGDTLFALESDADTSMRLAFEALHASNATDWISTPSYVDQCLADPSFNAELMPNLKRMLVAGETLKPATVLRVKERFPGIRFYNGYGPTESTDLVTTCEITDEMLASNKPLPIGYSKPNSTLVVLDPVTLVPVPNGSKGELFIIGETVAREYWERPEQTQAAFHSCPDTLTQGRRSYRTGDEVTMEDDGLIYFHGRLDLQIKLHGYRIELGDIESILCALPQVRMACVLPVMRDGSIAHLTAVIVPTEAGARGFALTKELKQLAKQSLPAYMIPSSFKYIDEMPLNPNGKADRKALAQLIGE
ncbi:MAG: amino acid adenylation domain-containing protein [Coriobacteriales bacterium]|nr:amino acid adenylation domain-containing protein [Coriobacteriales bacterium]